MSILNDSVTAYEASTASDAHECPLDDTCEAGEGFWVLGWVEGDEMILRSGGHKVDIITLAESMVKIIDSLVIQSNPQLPIHLSFAKARDIIHSAADGVAPPPDVSAALAEFLDNMGNVEDV